MNICYVNVIEMNSPWGAECFVNKGFLELGHKTWCMDFRKNRGRLARILKAVPHVDAFLLQRGDHFPPYIIKNINVPRFFWASELMSRTPDQIELLRHKGLFDHAFFRTPECIQYCVRHGYLEEKNASILLSGYDPEMFYKKNSKKDIDVLFIGNQTERRKTWLANITRDGIPLTCVTAYGPEMNEYLNRAKIVLNIHADKYSDTETRIYECLGSGAFVISEKLSSESPFSQKHLVEFGTYDEMCVLLKEYLRNESARDEIAMEGWQYVVSAHTYKKRASEIVEIMAKYISKPSPQKLMRSNLLASIAGLREKEDLLRHGIVQGMGAITRKARRLLAKALK